MAGISFAVVTLVSVIVNPGRTIRSRSNRQTVVTVMVVFVFAVVVVSWSTIRIRHFAMGSFCTNGCRRSSTTTHSRNGRNLFGRRNVVVLTTNHWKW